jgi:hypothetical protein
MEQQRRFEGLRMKEEDLISVEREALDLHREQMVKEDLRSE